MGNYLFNRYYINQLKFYFGRYWICFGIGLLNFTNNGGESWIKSNGFTTDSQVWDIDFSNSNLLFLSSFESQPIWQSTNGGINWVAISDIFVGGNIYHIDAVNDTICYGGGDGGFI